MSPSTPLRQRGHNTFRPRKTAMLVAQRMVSEITDGRLAPGTPLPPEREMLENYGVARGTLREALRFLEMQGIITIRTGPGGGPVVAQPESRHLASVMALHMQIAHASFRAVLEAREVLEPVMARQAALHIGDAELEALHASTEHMAANIDDVEEFLTENERFHALIASASGNELFALVIASLNWIVDATPLGVEYPRKQREAVAREHQAIYEAIARRDAAEAERAMAQHIGDFARYLRKQYPEVVDADLRWEQVG